MSGGEFQVLEIQASEGGGTAQMGFHGGRSHMHKGYSLPCTHSHVIKMSKNQ